MSHHYFADKKDQSESKRLNTRELKLVLEAMQPKMREVVFIAWFSIEIPRKSWEIVIRDLYDVWQHVLIAAYFHVNPISISCTPQLSRFKFSC